MSKLLIRTLKISILPAATMIVAKVVGVIIAASFFDVDIYIANEVQELFSVQLLVANYDDTLLINSISNLFMLLVMGGINAYLFIKFAIYQNSNNNPKTIVKLTKFNMVKWATDKETGFLKVFVWMVFLLSSNAVIIMSTLRGQTYQWIGVLAFISSIFFMWGVIRTFEKEISKIYPHEKEKSLY